MKRVLVSLFLAMFPCIAIFSQQSGEDNYQPTARGTFESRKADYLAYCTKNGTNGGLYGVFTQLARQAAGFPLQEAEMQATIDVIRSNRDCNDFTLNGLLRIVYLSGNKLPVREDLAAGIEKCILEFKYWWNDPRADTTYRCYHTENHQALYHTAELLAGQLYKDHTFMSGLTGRQHIAHAEELISRWLEYRFRFGFSEWMSSYYEVDILLLANIYDFAENESLKKRAGAILDLLMFDMALANYHGILATSSGRIYTHSLITGHHAMSPTLKLVFGEGQYLPENNMAGAALCSSTYRCPEIITEIATDYSRPVSSHQKVSIEVDDAAKYGLSTDSELDTHLFWGMQEFVHPRVVRMSKQMSEKYGTYPYRDYDRYIEKYEYQIMQYGKITDNRLDRFALSEANIENYRTPDYMISCAEDYRKGAVGYQQYIWQATLDNRAIVFTSHPGSRSLGVTPNYWAGNAAMPRAAQHKNVVVCIYNSPAGVGLDMTHAYFPKEAFDEIVEKGQWVFARKGDGYVALWSQNETEWKADAGGIENDLAAEGKQNVWICETGAKREWGSFSNFIEKVSVVAVDCDNLDVSYDSPSLGKIIFGWNSDFKIKDRIMPLKTEFRYDNRYSRTSFDSRSVEIRRKSKSMTITMY